MTIRHFLNLADAGPEGVTAILNDAQARKAARVGFTRAASMPTLR